MASIPRSILTALRHRHIDAAREALADWLAKTPAPADPLSAARVAQQVGLLAQAENLLSRALEHTPWDEALRCELAALLEDLGRDEDAETLRNTNTTPQVTPPPDRDTEIGPRSPEPPPPNPGAAIPNHDDIDLVRLHQLLGGREDVHARQWIDPDRGTGYAPIRKPLTPDLLRAHLHGSATLGVYPIRLDGTVTFIALDLDIGKRALEQAAGQRDATRHLRQLVHEEGLRLRASAEALGVPGILFDSGYKGRHLWILLREPLPAALAHRFGNALANHLAPTAPELFLEVFPRQAQLRGKALGNLIKIPLGIHLQTGRRACLLDDDGQPVDNPFPILHQAPRLDRETLLDLFAALGNPTPRRLHGDEPQHTEAPPGPGVRPPPPPAPFTESDFETRPALAALLRGCAVLDTLVRRGLEERRLDHPERIVLRHAMGHLPDGIDAVNYVFRRCPEIPPDALLGKRLAGSPISCARVRQRVPNVSSSVPCNCAFPNHPDQYPSPVLHAHGIPPHAPGTPPLDTEAIARSWVALQERHHRIEAELAGQRQRFIQTLEALPDQRLRVAGGTWELVRQQGLPVLQWTPDIGPEPEEP
ncbi:MAG: hypothetical protein EA398_00110 [Deltaproteobacteria bacterium]|nr:MAG: hypothetical protein EA398_00110 [Deltaproteobacteria bacterium]